MLITISYEYLQLPNAVIKAFSLQYFIILHSFFAGFTVNSVLGLLRILHEFPRTGSKSTMNWFARTGLRFAIKPANSVTMVGTMIFLAMCTLMLMKLSKSEATFKHKSKPLATNNDSLRSLERTACTK
jgi:hypothetical protein